MSHVLSQFVLLDGGDLYYSLIDVWMIPVLFSLWGRHIVVLYWSHPIRKASSPRVPQLRAPDAVYAMTASFMFQNQLGPRMNLEVGCVAPLETNNFFLWSKGWDCFFCRSISCPYWLPQSDTRVNLSGILVKLLMQRLSLGGFLFFAVLVLIMETLRRHTQPKKTRIWGNCSFFKQVTENWLQRSEGFVQIPHFWQLYFFGDLEQRVELMMIFQPGRAHAIHLKK